MSSFRLPKLLKTSAALLVHQPNSIIRRFSSSQPPKILITGDFIDRLVQVNFFQYEICSSRVEIFFKFPPHKLWCHAKSI